MALSGHPLLRLRMDMADRVRMCIDMGIGMNAVERAAREVVRIMVCPYTTKPAGWMVQIGGCW